MVEAKNPVVLCILDGWGHRDEEKNNAIANAQTPNWDSFLEKYPHSLIKTSGLSVGLPEGQMGNSEVGHMNIGAGRAVMQELPRIDEAIKTDQLQYAHALRRNIAKAKQCLGACHLMGLVSPGGVHSHQDHMVELVRLITKEGVPVRIHAFLDGRDTPPSSAKSYMEKFIADVEQYPDVKVATVSGRYYAMDRDNRWDRVEKAYNAMVLAEGEKFEDALSAISTSYENEVTDEFVEPCIIGDYKGMTSGDSIIVANFRADRVREITAAIADPDFTGFERKKIIDLAAATGMIEYSKEHNNFLNAIFPPQVLTNIFGEVIANAGLKQLRLAETEKYAHVTFFFNGGEEKEFPGEDRILVPSPSVATYDLQPEMSAPEVTEHLLAAIRNRKHDVIIVNYANGDMVGHTGVWEAAVKAVETVDDALGQIENALQEVGGIMLLTSDHGNCEIMVDEATGEPYTAHTVGEVPAVLVLPPEGLSSLNNGALCDLAPTLLNLLGLEQPEEMTGKSLI